MARMNKHMFYSKYSFVLILVITFVLSTVYIKKLNYAGILPKGKASVVHAVA